jgi:Asp-tRNA(Asn)/Glu-tRNA(Gln) amidotransferase A subunit family amidase
VVEQLREAGVAVVNAGNNYLVAEVEREIGKARSITDRVNAWEARWPLNTYRNKDASGLSKMMLDRLAQAESMRIEDYRRALTERNRARGAYAKLAGLADAAITLSATGAAPVGLESTGNPIFAVAGSMLGVPAISLPVLEDEGLPLGLQVMGFEQQDAPLFAIAVWLRDYLAERNA